MNNKIKKNFDYSPKNSLNILTFIEISKVNRIKIKSFAKT